jgi:asparagine synthase (glutamine-hydrolysing)
VEVGEFPDIVRAQFHFHDGQGILGVFDDGSDLATRKKRTASATLQLNGGGGEIYRNYWKLRDSKFRIRSFLKARFDQLDFSIYTDRFDKRAYWSDLTEKIRFALRTDQDPLDRRQIELIYPFLRLKYWMGQNNSSNNFLSFALTPFAEPVFAIPSSGIPLKDKNLGRFEAAVIRFVDPRLASYPSVYGFNFCDTVPPLAKLKNAAVVHCPVFVRPAIYRELERRRSRGAMPYYLSDRYLRTVLDPEDLEISRYVDIDRILDPGILSRALTAELIVSDRF